MSEWDRFRRDFAENLEIQRQLDQQLGRIPVDRAAAEVAAFARRFGYEIDVDEANRQLTAAAKVRLEGELSDDDLSYVSGGTGPAGTQVSPSQVRALILP